jgi:hypothetical protein
MKLALLLGREIILILRYVKTKKKKKRKEKEKEGKEEKNKTSVRSVQMTIFLLECFFPSSSTRTLVEEGKKQLSRDNRA